MGHIRSGVRWAGRSLRRLRALVEGDDHDPWYDDHPGGQKKPKPPRISQGA